MTDDRKRLEAARDRLEAVLNSPDTTPRDLAVVAREYRITIEKLATFAAPRARSPLDEIAARRAKRRRTG